MTRAGAPSAAARALAALATGTVLGAVTAGGTALLLYTGQGFLRAAGLLIASAVMAVAAGLWAGAPETRAERASRGTRVRWVMLVLVLLAGGLFTTWWGARPPLQSLALGGAAAVLLLLALPAYAAGSLLAGLHAQECAGRIRPGGSGVAAAAVAGAALGVLLATTLLIQTLQPQALYYAGAALLGLAALLDGPRGLRPADTGDPDMTDHVTLITGVGRRGQLGAAVAQRFAAAGAHVVITGLGGAVEELAAELNVVGVRADLLQDADAERVVGAVREHFGRLDSLINIAGGLTVAGTVADTTPADWERELQRNAGTALRMTRAALPLLRESRGAVVNFASPAGERALAGLGAYSAAKAAVIALTRSLALEELEHGVRVNAVAPGVMDTAQNVAAAGDVDTAAFVARADVAGVVLFLAGPGARAVTGQTLHVPGPTLT